MKNIVRVAVVVALCVVASRALATDNLNSYQTQLRQQIIDAARQLRDSRNGTVSTTGSSWSTGSSGHTSTHYQNQNQQQQGVNSVPGWNLADPFASVGSDIFGTTGWGNTPQNQPNPNSRAGHTGRSGRQANANSNQTLDLNGRPVSSLQPTRPTPTATPKTPAAPAAGAAAAGADTKKDVTAGAQVLFDNGEYGAARELLVPIAASVRRPADEVDAAKKFIEQIDTLGMKRLSEADDTAKRGEVDQAGTLYDELIRKFGASPAATLARAYLAVLKADPESAAKFLLDKATGYADRNRTDMALALLRTIAVRYSTTKAASAAAELLQKIGKGSGGVLTADQELAARKWLIIGDIHALNGRPAEAVTSYRQVIQEFEDTKYAEMARERIAAAEK